MTTSSRAEGGALVEAVVAPACDAMAAVRARGRSSIMRALSRCRLAAFLVLAAAVPAHGAGPELFAPSRQAGRALDAARALPATPLYTHVRAGAGDPGTLVATEAFPG